ncbi:hypothetical protein [Paenibacillus sp. FSL W8-1287]|uniref:hypothetical protein n=1 Tax=Paenibacillus sp. FSL W8-1287 TaxID=2954653 RepID=UPI0030CF2316
MADVYDFYSRRNFRQLALQDYGKNDEIVMTHGKYVGCLPQQQAKSILGIMSLMTAKKEQIDSLMAEFSKLQEVYNSNAIDSLLFLKAEANGINFDPETYELYVDVKGHCWVVKNEDCRR